MRSRFLILMAMLSAGISATASPVDSTRAAAVAQRFFARHQGIGQLTLAKWDHSKCFLFTAAEGGFVVVSSDDAAPAILAYSAQSQAKPGELPLAFEAIVSEYELQISSLPSLSLPQHPSWSAIEEGSSLKDGEAVVGPLVTALWSQREPYSLLCPGENGEHAVTGCAATAQAMMMSYWKHPAIGTGSHTYTDRLFGQLSANFGHTAYDWENMIDQPLNSSTDEEKHAVAELMYHIGVANEMSYGYYENGGSGALGLSNSGNDASINRSLFENFHYRNAMRVISRGNEYTDQRWRDSLIAELDLLHPIVYCAADDLGGHAFICDGYDQSGKLHFNFGWAGNGNGYFTVDHISPQPGAQGSFSRNSQALLGAEPDLSPIVGDTLMVFDREGGFDSVLFSIGYHSDAAWTATTTDSWLTVMADNSQDLGWVKVSATENSTNDERVGFITFRQGNYSTSVRVVQRFHAEEDYCPLTLVLESSAYPGWRNGAYLSLETEGGLLYGTATLRLGMGGTHDTLQFEVAPTRTVVVFHPGGNSDRYINYFAYNQYGEEVLSVVNALQNGGRHPINAPCAHFVGVDETEASSVELYPTVVDSWMNIKSESDVVSVEAFDMQGRLYTLSANGHQCQMNNLPAGLYMVRVVLADGELTLQKIVKL